MNNNLTDEQNECLEYVNKGYNLFITGPGGYGKSFTIKVLAKELEKNNKNYKITISTGI